MLESVRKKEVLLTIPQLLMDSYFQISNHPKELVDHQEKKMLKLLSSNSVYHHQKLISRILSQLKLIKILIESLEKRKSTSLK